MPTTKPPRSPDELARLGADVFDRQIRPKLRPEEDGKFVDVDTGDYDIEQYYDKCLVTSESGTMKTHIIPIGNSRGIRIPKLLLEQTGLSGEVESTWLPGCHHANT